jgi:FkbM family methyltransferase
MKDGYYIVNTHYGAFLTYTKDFIGSRIFHDQVWEKEMIDIYTSILQPHYIVVDIGAHMGFHTVNFAFYCKHVYAFEPQLPLYNQLRGNVFLNNLDNRITCFNIGLGETNKRSSFGDLWKHNSLNWDGEWKVELINYGGRSLEDNLGTNEIEIRTLDSFNLTPHFIKMDIEGYELKALQGAKKTIEKYKPILFFETFPEMQEEVFEFIKSIGYEIFNTPNSELGTDFIAIHPQFEDYINVKQIINKLK